MNEDILNQLGEPSEEPTEEVKVPDKKKSTGKKIDDEVIASMMANGDNTAGMFTPDESEVTEEDEELHEEVDEDAKLKTKGEAKPSEKYATEFQKDMIKNPEDYMINTPRGEMTVKEAMEAGYDPITKRFNNSALKKKEDTLNQLNDKDRAAVEKLFDPSQVGLAPADAEAMGVNANSPMIRQENPMEQQPAQVATPMSAPAQPTGQQPAPDINALLGGM
jgi:hypothetical protein